MYKILNKVLTIGLILTLALVNVMLIGIYGQESYATITDLEGQGVETNNSNVEFDSYFLNDNQKIHMASMKTNSTDSKLYLNVKVKNTGYLKNAQIEFADSNFKISDIVKNNYIQELDLENNKINLNQIGSNEETLIELPISFCVSENVNINEFSKENDIKLTGTYIDNNGKENKIEKTIKDRVIWTAEPEILLQQNIEKYASYSTTNKNGVLLQQSIKTGIKDNALPISKVSIELTASKIKSIIPQIYIRKADGTELSKENWNFNEKTLKLTIEEYNTPDENGNVKWNRQNAEEYIITYLYENADKNEQIEIPQNINCNITAYNGTLTTISGKIEDKIILKEDINSIVTMNTKISENTLSKGYMYSNIDGEEKEETQFNVNYNVDIAYSDVIDNVKVIVNSNKFITNNKEEYSVNSYIKNISINTNQFKEILGENGYIKIISNNLEVGKIILDENKTEEILSFDSTQLNVNNLEIETSKPQKSGLLSVKINNAIQQNTLYSKQDIQTFEELSAQSTLKVSSENKIINETNKVSKVSLIEPISKAEIQINKTGLSTITENENVELRAVLKTDSEYNSLYKNPTIEIVLPEEIENINIKGVELLFDNELEIESTELINNTIKIKLKGTQTKYSINTIEKGATVVVTADITLNKLAPSSVKQINLLYSNENTQSYEKILNGKGIDTVDIKYMTPIGIVPINTIYNYADNAKTMSIVGEAKTGLLEVNSSSKVATSEIEIINNYNNKINNVKILGRTLTKGTFNIETMEDLNNTFDAVMLNAIKSENVSLENVSIYYTENGKATQDIQLASNGWTKDVQDFSKVKSYLIMLNNYEMNTGDKIKFTYDAQIPENLNYNEKVNSIYTVYFDNIKENEIIKDKAVATAVTLSTGMAPTLEVNLSSYSEENTEVREAQYIKFKANVKNTGIIDAKNVKLNITAPSGNVYYYIENNKIIFTENLGDKQGTLVATYLTKHTEFVQEDYKSEYEDSEDKEKTILVGDIKAGESKQIEYELKLEKAIINNKDLPMENSKLVVPELVLNNKARVIADEMQKEVISNEYKLKATQGNIQILTKTDKVSDYILTKGMELTYTSQITNLKQDKDITNLEVMVKIPNGVTIKSANLKNRVITGDDPKTDINIDQSNNIVTFKIDKFEVGSLLDCNVVTQIDSAIGRISPAVVAKADGINNHYSNVIYNTVEKLQFEISQDNQSNQYVKEKEQITYTYKIKNTSNVYTNNVTFENKISEGMSFIKAELISSGISQTVNEQKDNKLTININSFKGGEELTIKVTMEANLLPDGTNEKEITNYAIIYGNGFETINSNSVKTIIEYNKEAHKQEENPLDNNDKYKISGMAWIDVNKNGQKEIEEKILSGIQARLINKSNNETVAKTYVSSEGKYTFENVEKGKYIVVFEYDSANYQLTQYKKQGVNESVNSDVITMNMNIDGTNRIVAVSDILEITDSNIRNINIGIYESQQSDLKLDKYISKVTLTYGNTTNTYEYKNEKLAKVEIPSKNLSDATVVVEYKIVVTNEGDISNYVKKIVDYVPKDMKFSSELNKDWYQSTNGDLYNSSLSNTKLEAGQSREVTLILSKKMTSENTGIINNNAELYEVYNEEGIQDRDSTPANKNQKEDDLSSADLIVSIKTGEMIAYTLIISIVICGTIGVTAYFAKIKFVNRRKTRI